MKTNREQWMEVYANGHAQIAPWDEVISFVNKNVDLKNKSFADTRILEVGSGTGGNLSFLSGLGFKCFGIEQDEIAIRRAMIAGPGVDYRMGDFKDLPWDSELFDLVIDRASLTYSSGRDLAMAIEEIERVLVPGGKFLFTPYVVTGDWRESFDLATLHDVMPLDKWEILSMESVIILNMLECGKTKTHHYRIVAQKRETL